MRRMTGMELLLLFGSSRVRLRSRLISGGFSGDERIRAIAIRVV